MKIPNLPEVTNPTGDEDVVIYDGVAKRTKLLRIVDAIMGVGGATAARDKAQKWADENEDVQVEPGKYSAKHWSLKGAASAAIAVAQAGLSAASAAAAYASQIAANAASVAATSAMMTAIALFNATGPNVFYRSNAALVAGFATAPNKITADVYPDSTRGNRATRYYKDTSVSNGAWIFVRYVDAPPTYYAHSFFGSDANDGLSPETAKQSLEALAAMGTGGYAIDYKLGRGSVWEATDVYFTAAPWSRISDYGAGERPIIRGDRNLFTPANWVQEPSDPTGETYYQVFSLPTATSGSTPGDVHRWHPAAFDEEPTFVPANTFDVRQRLTRGWLKRVLNGDPDPDPATFNINKVQTTTLAYAQRSDFIAKVVAHRNTMTVFPEGGSSYEPNDGTPHTLFRIYVHLRDGSDPRINGRRLTINQQRGLIILGKGMDVHNVIFARTGGKDMLSGFQDLSGGGAPRAPSIADIFSGNFYSCSFWLPGAHGPVCSGMGGENCDYVGHHMRDSYKGGAGAYHVFSSMGGANKRLGSRWRNCRAKRAGYVYYCHGNGDGSDCQQVISYIDGGWADDARAIAVGGSTSQGYWIRDFKGRDIDSCGATAYPESTYENCVIMMRPGLVNSLGGGSSLAIAYPPPNAGTARFINSLVLAFGTSLDLPMGPLATLTQDKFVNLVLERSTIWALNGISNVTNTQWRQVNVDMDESYLGPFDNRGQGNIDNEVYPTGTFTTRNGSIVETLRTAPETLRAKYGASFSADTETGIVRQIWQQTVTQADIVYVPPGNAVNTGTAGWIDNGDGTATIPTSFNYGWPSMSRAIKIAGANAGGADYFGRLISVPDTGHLIVSPLPTAAITTAKAISTGFFRPFPFKDPVTAYISLDGTQINVGTAPGFVVGQYVRVSHPVPGQPGFGVRRITALAGGIATLDKACPWKQRMEQRAYRSISTPTTGTGRSLPTVQISWGFPIQGRILSDASFHDPQIIITKAEGGTVAMETSLIGSDGRFLGVTPFNLSYNSYGNTYAYDNVNYEAGYWYQAISLAAGDVFTLYCLVDVAEYRLAFNSPPELGGYSPVNTCLLAQRKIGYRPLI